MGQMVIANRLDDGRIVFLAARPGDGATAIPGAHGLRWVGNIEQGTLAASKGEADHLLGLAREAELANQILAPTLIGIADGDGPRQPVDWREAIRAGGPTVRTDLLPDQGITTSRVA